MKEYNIDLHGEDITDTITFRAVQNLIHSKEYKSWQRLLLISDFVSNIKGADLLNSTLELIEKAGLIGYDIVAFKAKLLLVCKGKPYTEEDQTKINAIVFADMIAREIYNKLVSDGTAELRINIFERKVFTNINEIEIEFKRKAYTELTELIEIQPLRERETNLKDLLTTLAKYKYQEQTPFFDEEIEYFTLLKENLTPENGTKPEVKEIGKPGRKPAIVKPITEYFTRFDTPTRSKYLNALKEHFKDCSNKEFVFLIKGLRDLGDIKFDKRNEIYKALEVFFGGETYKDQSRNIHFNSNDSEFQTTINASILRIKEENCIF